jgi:hypothetical protein
MTNNQRRQYSKRYQQMLDHFELKHVGKIYSALRKHVSSYTSAIKTQGINAGRYVISVTLFNDHLNDPISKLYIDAGLTAARKVRAELRLEQQKRFGYNDELVKSILEYLNQYILDKLVRPVSKTTRDWVLSVIDKGIEEGKGAYEIAKEIEGSDFLKFQAIRIVRTETVRATNVGALKAAETSPFEVVKEWIAAHDNRTRHSHRLVDGQVQDMAGRFSNGLMQPGDPEAPAREVVSCRCTLAIIAKRDEDGRLIRRQRGIPITDSRQLFAV